MSRHILLFAYLDVEILYSAESAPNKYILSIEGGGFRALGCLLVLEQIMDEIASRSRQSLLPCQVFDLICGSSAGGLVAILLGRLGLDCTTAIKVYRDLARTLFGNSEQAFWDKIVQSSELDSKDFDSRVEQLLATDTDRLMVIPQTNNSRIHSNTMVRAMFRSIY